MPAGDRQHTWFPEMVEALRRDWHASLSWDELIALNRNLDAMLQTLRAERGITPPTVSCPHCGHRGPSSRSRVSVRATILALGRFGIAPIAHAESLERRWTKHRKEQALGLYGQSPTSQMCARFRL